MSKSDSGRFVDDLVARDLAGYSDEFSEADIEFARHNPSVLAKLADPLETKKRYIYVLFSIAVTMAAVSKVIEYTGLFEGNTVVRDLLTNVMFAISIELFGAAAVANLMELVFERRVTRNQQLVQALIHEATANDPKP